MFSVCSLRRRLHVQQSYEICHRFYYPTVVLFRSALLRMERNVQCQLQMKYMITTVSFDVLYDNHSVNKVVLKIKSLCLSANPAGCQRGLAHHMPNSPLAPCKYHKMSTGLFTCMCTERSPSIRLFALLFITCLCLFFPFSAFHHCLDSQM